jgi:hypothetical protein
VRSYFRIEGDKPTIEKDYRASRVYGIDVVDVDSPNQVVATVSADVTAGSVTIVGAASFDGTVLLVKVAGGLVGELAAVTFSWTTADGDSDSRTIYFRIVSR